MIIIIMIIIVIRLGIDCNLNSCHNDRDVASTSSAAPKGQC